MTTRIAAPSVLASHLREAGVRPAREFGQHFLVDGNLVQKIVDATGVGPGDPVLEIGAGAGVLTSALVETGARVCAIELDRRLGPILRQTVGDRAQVIFEDALEADWEKAAGAPLGEVTIVSNLPYNITSPVLVRLLGAPFRRAVLMMQEEVGTRLLAPPGERDRGSLTLLVESRADARFLFRVGPKAFFPPPKVGSAVLLLTPAHKSLHAQTESVWKGLFRYRRKTIRKGLQEAFDLTPAQALSTLETAGLETDLRPEDLALSQFDNLARALFPV